MCVCVLLQDVYAVQSSVCLLYTEAVCAVAGLLTIHSPAPASTQSHPLVPAFPHSHLSTASRLMVSCLWDVNVVSGEQQSFESCDSIVWHTPRLTCIHATRQGCSCGTDKAPKWDSFNFAVWRQRKICLIMCIYVH